VLLPSRTGAAQTPPERDSVSRSNVAVPDGLHVLSRLIGLPSPRASGVAAQRGESVPDVPGARLCESQQRGSSRRAARSQLADRTPIASGLLVSLPARTGASLTPPERDSMSRSNVAVPAGLHVLSRLIGLPSPRASGVAAQKGEGGPDAPERDSVSRSNAAAARRLTSLLAHLDHPSRCESPTHAPALAERGHPWPKQRKNGPNASSTSPAMVPSPRRLSCTSRTPQHPQFDLARTAASARNAAFTPLPHCVATGAGKLTARRSFHAEVT